MVTLIGFAIKVWRIGFKMEKLHKQNLLVVLAGIVMLSLMTVIAFGLSPLGIKNIVVLVVAGIAVILYRWKRLFVCGSHDEGSIFYFCGGGTF